MVSAAPTDWKLFAGDGITPTCGIMQGRRTASRRQENEIVAKSWANSQFDTNSPSFSEDAPIQTAGADFSGDAEGVLFSVSIRLTWQDSRSCGRSHRFETAPARTSW